MSEISRIIECQDGCRTKGIFREIVPGECGGNQWSHRRSNNVLTNAKGLGNWNDINTKIRFHQPFGAVNLTLDVPLNKYFTVYIGGGLGACYDVDILYLNNQEKLVCAR